MLIIQDIALVILTRKHLLAMLICFTDVIKHNILNMRMCGSNEFEQVKSWGSIASIGQIVASLLLKMFINDNKRCHIPLTQELNSIFKCKKAIHDPTGPKIKYNILMCTHVSLVEVARPKLIRDLLVNLTDQLRRQKLGLLA